MIASFFSMCSYALSPALLDQLKKDNIVDTTNTLSMNEIDHLKGQNQSLYKEKNIDFKILMIPSLGEISIEEYALDVFNTLKIGNKELDNGLLLVIAKDDRKMHFEVGYGLEGDITDAQAGRLIRNDLAPAFKQGEYFQGLSAIVPHLLDIETSSYNLKNSPPSEQIISNNNQNQFIVFLGVMLIYGFISLLTALPLLLIVYLVKRYKKPVQPEPPEIVIGTDGKQYIRIKKIDLPHSLIQSQKVAFQPALIHQTITHHQAAHQIRHHPHLRVQTLLQAIEIRVAVLVEVVHLEVGKSTRINQLSRNIQN